MRKYILDLTKAKLPKWWLESTPEQILVQDGRHSKDYDVTPQEMRKLWAKKHSDLIIKLNPDRLYSEEWPIGFNKSEMPKGAKLVELS